MQDELCVPPLSAQSFRCYENPKVKRFSSVGNTSPDATLSTVLRINAGRRCRRHLRPSGEGATHTPPSVIIPIWDLGFQSIMLLQQSFIAKRIPNFPICFLRRPYHAGGANGGYFGNPPPLIFSSCNEDDLRSVAMPELPSRRLEGFGAVFRDHFGSDYEFYLLLKQGHGGYRYHRTEGSFLLFVGGRPLIYDGGEAGETWRHSTLSFYDAEMPLASGHVERFHTLPGLGFVQGVHPVPIKPGDPFSSATTVIIDWCRWLMSDLPQRIRRTSVRLWSSGTNM